MSLDLAFNPPQFDDNEYSGIKMRQFVEEVERLHAVLTNNTTDEGVEFDVTSWNGRVGDVVPIEGDYDLELLGDVSIIGDSQYDMLFNATGTEYQDTNGELIWNHDLDFLQLANAHSINWLNASGVSVELGIFTSAGTDGGVGTLVAFSTDATNNIARSTDGGVTWTEIDAYPSGAPNATGLISFSFAQQKYIAFDGTAAAPFAYSSTDDGLTWGAIVPTGTTPSGTHRNSGHIEELGLWWWSASTNANGWYSADGVAWSQGTVINDFSNGIAYSPTLDIAVQIFLSSVHHWSDDALATWTATGTGAATDGGDIIWLPDPYNYFLVLSQTDRTVHTSTDGKTWTVSSNDVLPIGASISPLAMAYSPTLDILVYVDGSGPRVNWSDDGGMTWNAGTGAPSNLYRSVVWDDQHEVFVANEGTSGAGDIFIRSTDGKAWTTGGAVTPGFGIMNLIYGPSVLPSGIEVFVLGDPVYGTQIDGLTTNITSAATDIDGTLNADGAVTFQSTLDVVGEAVVGEAIRVLADIVTATPPSSEAVTAGLEFWDSDETDSLAKIGFFGSNDLRIENYMEAGDFHITGTRPGGAQYEIFAAGDVHGTFIYSGGEFKLVMTADEIAWYADQATASPPTTEAITFQHVIYDSTDPFDPLASWGFIGSNEFQINNLMHGGDFRITAEDASGVERDLFLGDPDGATTLFYGGAAKLSTYADGVSVDTEFSILNGGDSVVFDLDLTDLNTTFVGITDWNITGITSIQAGTVDADFDAITATSYGGVDEANLLDKTDAETVSGAYTFTVARSGLTHPILMQSINPFIAWDETDAAVDEGIWQMGSAGGDFYLRSLSDAGANLTDVFQVNRTGATVSDIMFGVDTYIREGSALRIYDTSNSDYGQFVHDGTDFIWDADSTTTKFTIDFNTASFGQLEVLGLTGGLSLKGQGVFGGSMAFFNPAEDGTLTQYFDTSTSVSYELSGVAALLKFTGGDEYRTDDLLSVYLTGGAAQDGLHLRDNTDATDLVFRYDGVDWELRSELAGSGNQYMWFDQSLGRVGIYNLDILRLQTWTSGSIAIKRDGNTDAEANAIQFQHQDGTLRARIGYITTNSTMYWRNQIHGGEIQLEAEDAGGTVRAGAIRVGTASSASAVGFHNTAPIVKPTVTGSRGGNAALASLLTALANYGLIVDSST